MGSRLPRVLSLSPVDLHPLVAAGDRRLFVFLRVLASHGVLVSRTLCAPVPVGQVYVATGNYSRKIPPVTNSLRG